MPTLATCPTLSLYAAQQLALDLMAAHGLHDWTFAFNRRRCSLGYCWYERKTIELSVYFVERNGLEAIRETVLHEIAHALVGPEFGHGPVWQAKARAVGCKPERLGRALMPQGCWQAQCPCCQSLHYRHRKPKELCGWFCKRCGEERGSLVWQRI